MFWKTDNPIKIKSGSLVDKFVILYTLTTVSIIIVVCLILFPTFEKVNDFADIAIKHNLMSHCILKLIVALSVGFISAMIFGKIIGIRVMNYLNTFSEQICQANVELLNHKINLNKYPKELRPLAHSFNMMLEKMQCSFDRVTQFSADIAHELRTPLHNLIGINEVALTKEILPEKYRTVLESNLKECQFLSELLEHLWFLARSDHGQILLQKTYINAREEISKLIEYYEPYANEKNISLICDGDGMIYVDKTLFKRTLSNIICNSLRYTPCGGKININIVPKLPEAIRISVHDTGIGIDPTHLTKIFDRFYRVDSSRSSKTGGIGLGLAIVKSVMNLHQGKIQVESEKNQGTSIYLEFPHQQLV